MRDTVTTLSEVSGFGCWVAAAYLAGGLAAALVVGGCVLVALGVLLGRR